MGREGGGSSLNFLSRGYIGERVRQFRLSGKCTREQTTSVSIGRLDDIADGHALQVRDPVSSDGDVLRHVRLVLYGALRSNAGVGMVESEQNINKGVSGRSRTYPRFFSSSLVILRRRNHVRSVHEDVLILLRCRPAIVISTAEGCIKSARVVSTALPHRASKRTAIS